MVPFSEGWDAYNFTQTLVSMGDGYFARKDCIELFLGARWLAVYLGVSA
jgi:hypothetical protein